jgi:2-polyprenyl-6-methoxyphenol hydroxylase-like FAD-dependent oxidoreductase
MTKNPTVLIIGAGPTGLFLAYALTRQGVDVRIIDQKAGPTDQSRAMGVHARTLEFYRQFGLADKAVALGTKTGDVHLAVDGRPRVRFSLKEMGKGQSHFPFLLTLAQDVHERFLLDELASLCVQVEWQTSLVSLSQSDDFVTAMLRNHSKEDIEVSARYLVGCDGASSVTRHCLDIGFGGGTNEGHFYVADVETSMRDDDIHVGIGDDTFSMMMPVRTSGTKRLIGIVDDRFTQVESPTFADISAGAEQRLNITIDRVNWFSVYKTHHRVAERFKKGRCFLAGDAGHIHSPIGGQGMNTGLGDAMNLAWKLAHVIRHPTASHLLESYSPERRSFAKTLVATTDRAFSGLMNKSWLARFGRGHLVAPFLGVVTRFKFFKKRIFKLVSQIRIHYRDSALSVGPKGALAAGDRLPYLPAHDNHAPLCDLDWQVHAYGRIDPRLSEAVVQFGLKMHHFASTRLELRTSGLNPKHVYLIRPDGHIGLIFVNQDISSLTDYLKELGLA